MVCIKSNFYVSMYACMYVYMYAMVWHGLVLYGMAWYGMVWYGMVCMHSGIEDIFLVLALPLQILPLPQAPDNRRILRS